MLTLNNLPNVKAPANPQPNKLIANIYNEGPKRTENNEKEQNMEGCDSEDDTPPPQTVALHPQQTPAPLKKTFKTKAKDIGLQIHTSNSTGWPKETLTRKKLMEGIEERKYKIIFTAQNMDANKILQAIENDDIDLEQCWTITEDTQFRKLRSGRIMGRTPPSRPEKQRKNTF